MYINYAMYTYMYVHTVCYIKQEKKTTIVRSQ